MDFSRNRVTRLPIRAGMFRLYQIFIVYLRDELVEIFEGRKGPRAYTAIKCTALAA